MRILPHFIFTLLGLLIFSQQSYSQTVIPGGDVYGNWTADGSPYQVMGDISIPDLSTLAIDPGVTIEFQGHYALYVNGRLLAQGSEADSIIFTVNDTTGFSDSDTTLGGWYGIKIADTPEQNDTTKLLYCKLQYGKAIGPGWWLNAGGAICIVNFDKVIISHCYITHNMAGGSEIEVPAGGGIHLAWADAIITDNTISYNSAIAGGAIQIHDSHPTFANNIFQENYAHEGGGISTGGLADITFNGDSFINNISTEHGGGIMCLDPENWIFNDVTFSGNIAMWGGGLGLGGGNVQVNNCIFDNNIAFNIGGGIAADFCNLDIQNTSFVNDSSYSISGALHNWHGITNINNCTFLDNYAGLGGAIYADYSSISINKAIFNNNSAESGGALRFWCSNLDIDSVLFQQNHVTYQGGAIEYTIDTFEITQAYNLKVENSQFIENIADFRCGAALIEQYNADTSIVNIQVKNCEFSENHAERIGAIRINGNSDVSIYQSKFLNNSSDLWTGCMTISSGSKGNVENCLFAYNSAGTGSSGAFGGGNGSHINFINCSFAGNSGTTCGGIGLRNNATANVINSIFWGNNPKQFLLDALSDSTPCMLYINYCDVQHGADSIISDSVSSVYWGSGNLDAQPMFADILNEDFTLSENSPCIGEAIDSIQIENEWFYCPSVDMDGNPRPNPSWTMPDMGAYESALPDTVIYVPDQNNLPEWRCYPNPFAENIIVEYYLFHSSMVGIEIIDHLGHVEMQVVKPYNNIGRQTILIDGLHLSPGIYICKFNDGFTIKTSKLIKSR